MVVSLVNITALFPERPHNLLKNGYRNGDCTLNQQNRELGEELCEGITFQNYQRWPRSGSLRCSERTATFLAKAGVEVTAVGMAAEIAVAASRG